MCAVQLRERDPADARREVPSHDRPIAGQRARPQACRRRCAEPLIEEGGGRQPLGWTSAESGLPLRDRAGDRLLHLATTAPGEGGAASTTVRSSAEVDATLPRAV
jgi:hypothetical protein